MRTAAHWKAKASGTSPEILRDDRILFVILLAQLPVVMFLVPVGFGTDVFAIDSSLLVGILTVAAYLTLAQDMGVDPAQLAIAFVTSRPFVTSNIIGATTMAQLKTDLASVEFSITPEIERRIDAIHHLHSNPAP